MQNDLKIFENEKFGQIRTVVISGEPYFVGNDVAAALGYSNTRKAVPDHVDNEDKLRTQIRHAGQSREMTVINESGLYSLILSSKLPQAKSFKRWVTSEVLPSIRKTGSYKAKPLDETKSKRLLIMERNAKVREAKLWKELAEGATGTYAEVCKTYAVNTLAGKEVLSLPEAGEKTYSATEVGKILGISANMVGKIANKYKLKIDKFGKWFHDKSQHSSKEVETFRYNEDGIAMLRSMAQMKVTENDDEVTYSTTVDLTEKGGKRFCAPLTISLPKKC